MSPKFTALARAPLGVAAVLAAAVSGSVAPSVATAQNVPTLSGLNAGPGLPVLQRVSLNNPGPFFCSGLARDEAFEKAKAEQRKATQNHTALQAYHATLTARARTAVLTPQARQALYQQINNVEVMMSDQDRLFIQAGDIVRAVLATPVIVCTFARSIPVKGQIGGMVGAGGGGTQIQGPTAPVRVPSTGGALGPKVALPGAPLLVAQPLR